MTFTDVTARTLAELPGSPLTSKAFVTSLPPQQLRLLPVGTTETGMGLAPTGKTTPSRRTPDAQSEDSARRARPWVVDLTLAVARTRRCIAGNACHCLLATPGDAAA